ncbi:hypothetical protein PR048_004796 [Dryococelus australis]|uniref:Uncharacterized protein n=1 Tax=Dryococelus australis TaxID=614101 RepID=A0ABQ9I6E1_9NEOP|nr:hypothetical protein PR048_004796 [Dryococelus australis]
MMGTSRHGSTGWAIVMLPSSFHVFKVATQKRLVFPFHHEADSKTAPTPKLLLSQVLSPQTCYPGFESLIHPSGVTSPPLRSNESTYPAGAAVAEQLAFLPPTKVNPGSIPSQITRFSQVGIMLDNSVG